MPNDYPNDTATQPNRPGLETPERIRVWDPLVRVFHWSLVGAFATAFILEDDLLGVHVWAGYLVLALVAVRLVWGLIGTRHARFSDFVRGPRAVLAYLRAVLSRRAPRYLGHNPAGGAMILLLLIALAATGISGLALYGAEEFAGPLAGVMRGVPAFWGEVLEETHEVLANLTLGLILIHVAGVLVSSWLHRENLIAAMISGYKRQGLE
ncbi:cytochrome b/b6 domain-containing protein [Thermochromatium tepidum]|jgi:Cytochrome b|uniref:Cytochrome B n=1 Tax=Thermochromatium tepidum ATCC 43061 TaxID=316276 RepID=A0A6I6EAN7_THETI|nr:cytochrome b/b6 domain-containing protein [Thermochromatium tepidum]QGU33773.1 cytochrome B [Thermochromatium tepidum ATCC 43061]